MSILTLQLQQDAEKPLYLQIYEHIKTEIINGNISSDFRLPSKRQLSTHLQCSLNTVQTAYSQLISEGYILSVVKKGYFACKLDNVVHLKTAFSYSEKNSMILPSYKYDFSYHGVDKESFPFSTWRKISKDEINEYAVDLLKIGEPQGNLELRSCIANYLHHSRGVECNPAQIIVSSGTEFLLQQLIQLFDKNCTFAIENPGYEKLNHIFKSNRAHFIPVSVDENGISLKELAESKADIVCVTPSHQFPTGNIMPVNRRINLLNWAHEKDERYIIEDDYDSEFKYSGKPIPSLQGLDKGKKVIYMGAFSKSLSPALRVSYMVLPEQLLNEYIEKLSFYICPVPAIEQKILSRFIKDGYFERHLNKMRNIYKTKREALTDAIGQLLPFCDICGANAGLHLILKVKNGMNEARLISLARENSIKVYGISQYYFENPPCQNSVPSILLGFAGLSPKEIYDVVYALSLAWKSCINNN